MQELADDFKVTVGAVLDSVSQAAADLEATANAMNKSSERTRSSRQSLHRRPNVRVKHPKGRTDN